MFNQRFAAVGAALILVGTAGASAAHAQAMVQRDRGGDGQGGGRAQMQRCVDRVLGNLARVGGDEVQAGPAVLSQCDGPLRAAVADAIRTGEAFICGNVDSCMPMARERASFEARDLFRRRMQQR